MFMTTENELINKITKETKLKEKSGSIINISSVSERVSAPFIGPYCMTKFALEAYSDALRREIYPLGMNV